MSRAAHNILPHEAPADLPLWRRGCGSKTGSAQRYFQVCGERCFELHCDDHFCYVLSPGAPTNLSGYRFHSRERLLPKTRSFCTRPTIKLFKRPALLQTLETLTKFLLPFDRRLTIQTCVASLSSIIPSCL